MFEKSDPIGDTKPGELLTARIRKRWLDSSQEANAFELDVDLKLPSGFTILFGTSGAGKTTLLDCVAGLSEPDEGCIQAGEVTFFDRAVKINLSIQARRTGYVFQDLALFPHLSVEQNVAYGLNHLPASERALRVSAILRSFHVEHLRSRKPREISGGERQRTALARTLVTSPRVLLLDEPLSKLDPLTKSKILSDLRLWNEENRIPILYVTHSRDEVFALGERVVVLEQGKVAAYGNPHQVMMAPWQESVAQLAGFENILQATVVARHPERGTLTCRMAGSALEIETPLGKSAIGDDVKLGIRAGDILLAISSPIGLSARNLIPGRVVSLIQRDVTMVAEVDCGISFEVHLTLAARDSLQLTAGKQVWLVIKTYSCHLLAS